jgi:hypothetical protein
MRGKLATAFRRELGDTEMKDLPKLLSLKSNNKFVAQKFADALEDVYEPIIDDGPFKDDLKKSAISAMQKTLKKNFKTIPQQMVGALKRAVGL